MDSGLGPLPNGQRVAVIGGGPGGTCAALALVRMAKERGRAIEVILFEPKEFGAHYNQCAGVLSPPIQGVLRHELELTLPPGLLQRKIAGYVLYGEHEILDMPAGEDGEATYAVRRVQFDRFFLDAAEKAGVQVERSRVYDLEFGERRVILYSDGGSWEADVVVGAFGLDRTVGEALARQTGYRLPPFLETVVTKIHPAGLDPVPALLQDRIHAFLPRLPAIEFGALIPKGNHITIIIAGRRVSVTDMQAFLDLSQVRRLLPPDRAIEHHFKGAFPVGPARRPFGNRYVTIGDAAGLVRPFKGKGIPSAALTGIRAARTMLDLGVSEEAFHQYYASCADITRDRWYGRAIRHLARFTSKRLCLDPSFSRPAAIPPSGVPSTSAFPPRTPTETSSAGASAPGSWSGALAAWQGGSARGRSRGAPASIDLDLRATERAADISPRAGSLPTGPIARPDAVSSQSNPLFSKVAMVPGALHDLDHRRIGSLFVPSVK